MPHPSDWLLWQLADSAFPSGGFAHSNGVEALWKQGEIDGPEQLATFLGAALRQLRHTDLPLIAGVMRDDRLLAEADALAESMNLNTITRRASRLQGRALLSAAVGIFDSQVLRETEGRLRRDGSPRHLPVAFGAVASCLGIEPRRALSLYLFIAMRSMASAAVRLGIVGPLGAQTIQHRLSADAEAIAADAIGDTLDQAHQPAPLLDLLQANHDRLYSKLFQS